MNRKHLIPATVLALLTSMPLAAHAAEGEDPSFEPGASENGRDHDTGATRYQFSIGGGYDSNAFQAPDAPYVDYYAGQLLGGGINPVVVPQKQAGVFLPYEFKLQTSSDRKNETRTLSSVKAHGRFYPSSKTRPGSAFTVVAQTGKENLLARDGKKEDTFYYGALLRKQQQTYTDHDTGLPKTTTVSGTSIANRYNHTDIGAKFSYKHRTGGSNYGIRGQLTQKFYSDPVAVAPLDHTFLLVGADTAFKLGPDTKLDLDGSFSMRRYSARHSHDLQGAYAVTNPLLNYSFLKVDAKLDHRFSHAWSIQGEYKLTLRSDGFVHYNDYTENRVGGRLKYKADDFRGSFFLGYLSRNYPNAFAYDTPGQPAKTYSGFDVQLKGDWKMEKGSLFWTELSVRRRNTPDKRFAYSRTQLMAGKIWKF